MAAEADYTRLFGLLETCVKPLLEQQLANNNILAIQANQGWIAWLNIKQMVMAMLRNKLSAADAIESFDLVQHILKAGYSIEDMHRWVDMLQAADEEERARLRAAEAYFEPTPVLVNPTRPATEEDFAPGGMLDFLTGPNTGAKAA